VPQSAEPKTQDRGVARRSLVVLGLASFALFIAATRVPLCPMAGLLGVPCPGCGLTRATFALLHGDFRRALELHPLAPLIAPIFIGAGLSAALGYVRGPQRRAPSNPWLASRAASVLAGCLLAATLGVWGARFLGYFGGPAPVQTFRAWAGVRHASSAVSLSP